MYAVAFGRSEFARVRIRPLARLQLIAPVKTFLSLLANTHVPPSTSPSNGSLRHAEVRVLRRSFLWPPRGLFRDQLCPCPCPCTVHGYIYMNPLDIHSNEAPQAIDFLARSEPRRPFLPSKLPWAFSRHLSETTPTMHFPFSSPALPTGGRMDLSAGFWQCHVSPRPLLLDDMAWLIRRRQNFSTTSATRVPFARVF